MSLFDKLRRKKNTVSVSKESELRAAQFMAEMQQYMNRPLAIEDILSRPYSPDVLLDAYDYYMRKYDYDCNRCSCMVVRDFLLTELFESEVNNGGLSQFLFNSSGNDFEDTISALRHIRADNAAEILEKVRALFPGNIVPRDREMRCDLMEKLGAVLEDALDKWESPLYAMDFSSLQYAYLQMHKAEFLSI